MQSTSRVLGAGKLKNAYHARGDFMVDDLPNDTMIDEVLAPGFWANHWKDIKRGARIEVMRSDNTLDATLRCLGTAPGLVATPPHLVTHPLAVLLRHLLPALATLVAEALPILLRHLLPLLTHFLAHLAALVRRQLRVHRSGDREKRGQHQHHTHELLPGKHSRGHSIYSVPIVASLCRGGE